MKVSWTIFKNFVDERSLSVQWIDLNNRYWMKAFDEAFVLECDLAKDPSDTDELDDFETNYKSDGNRKLGSPKDSDGSLMQRTKITTTGWHYQLHGIEFSTSQLDSVVSNKSDGTSFGFSTIKCYDVDGIELTTQETCNTSAVHTVIDWEPTHDYEIIGGILKQKTIPASDVRLWVVGVPDIPAIYGGSKPFVTNINLSYIGLEDGVRVDGRSPKYMAYSASYHTNKLRLIFKHVAGLEHPMHMIFEMFIV